MKSTSLVCCFVALSCFSLPSISSNTVKIYVEENDGKCNIYSKETSVSLLGNEYGDIEYAFDPLEINYSSIGIFYPSRFKKIS